MEDSIYVHSRSDHMRHSLSRDSNMPEDRRSAVSPASSGYAHDMEPLITEATSTEENRTYPGFHMGMILRQLKGLFAAMFPPVQNASLLFGHLQVEPILSAGSIGLYYFCLRQLCEVFFTGSRSPLELGQGQGVPSLGMYRKNDAVIANWQNVCYATW
ncbi:hypothetical protein F5Y00DRAFT_216746 [Daldinia vernicosa]|uniref:uncharacterized protein n=1 Tax=Daldinia vernicosa TaxID=114800 RepID=UPI0020074D91|nr:uncharacterized protein F5Y00DRAFT_216746 [Daldinia vernicosa]KAI0851745.1 hypothetical protein F5Y00DRAFT_216746 [Daldinia vernicosa]